MPLLSIESLIKSPPTGKVFFIDTNFIIACSEVNSKENDKIKAQQLKEVLSKNNCYLIYNVITKNELLHHLREFNLNLFFATKDSRASENLFKSYEGFLKVNSYLPLSKWILQSGFGSILLEIFGQNGRNLEAQFNDLTDGFIYASDYNDDTSNITWANVFRIMSEHALDSSDAMILNYALSTKDIHGFISLDSDFNYCNNTGDFVISIPSTRISDKTRNKPWRSN